MRDAIREHLLTALPGVFTDIYEPHMAEGTTPTPYAVIRFGNDVEEEEWKGFRRTVEIWPFVSRTTFTTVDSLANQVIEALEMKPLVDPNTGEIFSCSYDGTAGSDEFIPEFNVITRGIRFSVMAIRAVEQPGVVAVDPWVEALSKWTEILLGPTWKVYRHVLPVGYQRPCVLWRIRSVRTSGANAALSLVRKTMVGHVIGTTADEETGTIVDISRELMHAIKIVLDLPTKAYLTVDGQTEGNTEVRGEDTGQLTVTLKRYEVRPRPQYPLMAEAEGERVNEKPPNP